MTFKLSRRKLAALHRVLAKRRKVLAMVKVTAMAADGAKVTARRRINLVR